MKEWKEKNKALNEIIKSACETFIFIEKGEHQSAVGMKGSAPDLLTMLHNACDAVHGELEKRFGKEIADELIKTVLYTEKEMDEEMVRMKKRAETGIPKWLRKLMELESDEDEDDSTDEAECEEASEEEDDDEGCDADLNVRVDLHVHDSDDDRK